MTPTLAQVLPLAIGASFSPSGLLLVIGILSSKGKPRRKALAFLLGSTLLLLVAGLVVLLVLRSSVQASPRSHRVSAIIDIALGLIIVMVVARSVLAKKTDKPVKRERKVPYGLVGFSFMLVNTSTLVLYIAAAKIIAEQGHGLPGSAILLTIIIVVTMSMIALPVLIAYALPQRSERMLKPVSSWLSKHGSQVANAYFMLMAIYLLVRGIRLLG